MKYLLALLCLAIAEWLYLLLAKRLKIGASVTERSSHTTVTPTGGGVIFILSAIAFGCVNASYLPTNWWWMLGGAAVLGIVSFYDDIHPLPPVPRLLMQIVVMAVAFYQLCYPEAIYIYLLTLICGIGCINTFNFIDGIAGMLALYGIVVVGTLLYALSLYDIHGGFLYISLCTMLFLALVVFSCYNLPDKIFAGDVGAITLGFFVAYVLLNLMLSTGNASLVIFIIVGVFDACMTTLQRLFAGENILMPHREFIYEVLTSKWKLPHLAVSSSYALLQMLINALYFLIPVTQQWTYLIVVTGLLTTLYFSIRRSPRSR